MYETFIVFKSLCTYCKILGGKKDSSDNYEDSESENSDNNEASDNELDFNEDYYHKTVSINIHGKKIRGVDLESRLKCKLLSPSEYF